MAQKNLYSMFFGFVVLVILGAVSAQVCSDKRFFRPNSTYDENRRLFLSSLASNVSAQGGFYNASAGQEPDRVYALGMCIPEVEATKCFDCIKARSEKLIQNCPNQTEAFDWDGNDQTFCLVRYSNRSFFGSLSASGQPVYNTGDIDSNVTEFYNIWDDLITRMIARASSGRSPSKVKYYAAEIAAAPNFQKIYALMQCTSDLPPRDCNYCLEQNVAAYQSCCRGKRGGVVSGPSCLFRWELYRFFGAFDDLESSPPPLPETQLPPSPADGKSVSTGTIVAIVVPVAIVILVLLALGFAVCWRRKSYEEMETESEADSSSSLKFDYSIVLAATNDFSEENKLGEGGFGPVYKGKLVNGVEVAVKRLSTKSGQGDQEFKNEILLLSGLQHRNLVKLLGYCLKEGERLLVYEFLPNSSLDHLIFDPIRRPVATWNIRHNIIGGIARGLLYLHEDSRLKIIHRDLKPSNILLENEMNPKISDFGMARLFTTDETQANTSKVMGTYGYMAPEYILYGQFSVKSDVYSFGIMILEIISGQKSNSFQPNGLSGYAWMRWREGQGHDIIDPFMRGCSGSEVIRCIHIGLLCVQEDVARRPTMNSVVLWLGSSSVSLPVPTPPAFFMRNSLEPFQSESKSSDREKSENFQVSSNEVTMTELEAR